MKEYFCSCCCDVAGLSYTQYDGRVQFDGNDGYVEVVENQELFDAVTSIVGQYLPFSYQLGPQLTMILDVGDLSDPFYRDMHEVLEDSCLEHYVWDGDENAPNPNGYEGFNSVADDDDEWNRRFNNVVRITVYDYVSDHPRLIAEFERQEKDGDLICIFLDCKAGDLPSLFNLIALDYYRKVYGYPLYHRWSSR